MKLVLAAVILAVAAYAALLHDAPVPTWPTAARAMFTRPPVGNVGLPSR